SSSFGSKDFARVVHFRTPEKKRSFVLRSVLSFHQRHFHQVLAQKPDVHFVGAEDVADDHVVGAVVAQFGGAAGQGAAVADDDLVSVQQARELDGDLFPAPRRALDLGGFGDVVGHGDAHAAEDLDAFGNGVD